ncbi:ABC transporter ATP-binding protein [Corynebacterium sp. 320]|uniref:ABC transporter ATP-binding protein n=1 Tax=Corynebacterium TaxID=1716 RepID=UPI00125CBFD3|nr:MULTISPECIES: ABC transporter ATP-binding protein [Corynebacterium]KAB1504289.1 ABC transporter ATP-binding protein [Corynebacterium sp. 320]KAB1552611.1 ABC transporter ATP-binding protein [Corynebacterium sp. 321]KAB1554171.1 ABC transporter ATP-binding protein [Corynebacterium sp. 319]KAB3528425.1 ABC transporter ATP-binding protein [Corynebacterium sp. 250]KAB3540085.1 ABC transporter ATP-binding protein [Corynebacterium sp. 366]
MTTPTPAIDFQHTSIRYPGHTAPLLDSITLALPAGGIHGIIGPNGAGKSTLVKALLGLVPYRGSITALGADTRTLTPRRRARMMAYVPQSWASDIDFTTRRYVELARYARVRRFRPMNLSDAEAIDHALHLTGTAPLAHTPLRELSGGQQQLVNLARAIAQEPQVLVLDEPTSALDISHMHATIKLLRPWIEVGEQPRTVVTVLHDLELAGRYCSTLTLLHEGRVHAHGTPAQVLTTQNLRAAFGVDVDVGVHPGGWPTITVR